MTKNETVQRIKTLEDEVKKLIVQFKSETGLRASIAVEHLFTRYQGDRSQGGEMVCIGVEVKATVQI